LSNTDKVPEPGKRGNSTLLEDTAKANVLVLQFSPAANLMLTAVDVPAYGAVPT